MAGWSWFISGLLAAPACATPATAPQQQTGNLTATDMFDVADAARGRGDLDDAITIYDALAHDPDPDVRAEARFRKGLMLADARRFADAAIAFRAVLDEKPDATAVRLELARMLAALGEEAAARRELRQARAAGVPAEAAVTVEQFANVLRATRRIGGSFELALAPDSNINRATQARSIDTVIAPLVLSRDARASSGLGLRTVGQGFAKLGIADNLLLVPRLSALANLYRAGAFNDVSGSALVGLEWQHGRDIFSPSIGRSWRWYGGRRYAQTNTAALDWLRPTSARSQLIVSGSAGTAHYSRNSLQDGEIYDINLSFERAFGAKRGGSVALSATRQTARDRGYATWAGGVNLLGWSEVNGATLYLAGGLRRTEGDARLFLFPDRRREWLVSARAGATLRKLAVSGFAPLVRLSYEHNGSSVGIYDYSRVSGEFGIVRAF